MRTGLSLLPTHLSESLLITFQPVLSILDSPSGGTVGHSHHEHAYSLVIVALSSNKKEVGQTSLRLYKMLVVVLIASRGV